MKSKFAAIVAALFMGMVIAPPAEACPTYHGEPYVKIIKKRYLPRPPLTNPPFSCSVVKSSICWY